MVKSLEKLTKKIFSKKNSYGFDFSPISPKLMWILFISLGTMAITGIALGIAAVVKDSKVEGPQGPQGQRGIPGKNGVDGACTTCDTTFKTWYDEAAPDPATLKGESAYTQWFDTICQGGNDPLISKDNGALLQKLNGKFVDGEWKDGRENSGCTPDAFYNWLAMKSREQIQGGFGNDPAEPYKITVANATNATNATNADNLKQGEAYVGGSALEVEKANKADNLKQGEGYVGGSELIVDKADKADKLKNEYVALTKARKPTADSNPTEMPYATADRYSGNTFSPYMTRDEYVPSTQLSVKNAVQLYSGRGTSKGDGWADPTFMPMWNLNVGNALEADVAQKANRLYNGGQGFARWEAKGGGWYEPFQSCLVKWSEEAVGNGRGNPLH